MDGSALARSIFEQAVTITDAYARTLLQTDGMAWGPRHVRAAVGLPQVGELLFATLGAEEPWREEWGEPVDFTPIAENKLLQSLRAGGPSSSLATSEPWHLRPGDYLGGGGVCSQDKGIAVGVAGATGLADETIAQALLITIVLLYRRWAESFRTQGVDRVQ